MHRSKNFRNIRYLIAVHGAGMINVIYRQGAPLHVLELQSNLYSGKDLTAVCEEFGYNVSILTGPPVGGSSQTVSFRIDPDKLEQKILGMLTQD